MAHFVRAAWSLKATPQSKTHLTASPLASKAPMVLTYCGILADGASIVYRMSTHLTGTDKNCKRCVAIAEKAPEVHSVDVPGEDTQECPSPIYNGRHVRGDAGQCIVCQDGHGPDCDATFIEDCICEGGGRADSAKRIAAYEAEVEATRPVEPGSWAAVRRTPAFTAALHFARESLKSEAKLAAAREGTDDDTFSNALRYHRNDLNVLWGAASVLAALVDNEDVLGAHEVLLTAAKAELASA
jgi:hypothetical protein